MPYTSVRWVSPSQREMLGGADAAAAAAARPPACKRVGWLVGASGMAGGGVLLLFHTWRASARMALCGVVDTCLAGLLVL